MENQALQRQEEPEFVLLSDALMEIIRNPDDTPVFKKWLSYLPYKDISHDFYDEEEIMTVVEAMLKLADSEFVVLPEKIRSLGEAMRKADLGGDRYKRFALTKQLERMEINYLSPDVRRRMEKTLRGLYRGMHKRQDVFDRLVDSSVSRLSQTVDRKLKNMKNLTPEKGICIIIETGRQIVDEIMKKSGQFEGELLDISQRAESLESRLEETDKINNSIRRIRQRLEKFGGELHIGYSMREQEQQPAPAIVRIQTGEPVYPQLRKKNGKENRDAGASAISPKTPENGFSQFDAARLTIQKIRDAIKAAEQYGKLRILVPKINSYQASYGKKWENVLSKLDYTGPVEFVLFRDLSRTTDTLSPVVIPRAMNTHRDLWSRENFENIYVLDITSPGSINSLLNCAENFPKYKYGEDEAEEDND